MPHFIKDTHYRNMFEVNRGRGTRCEKTRRMWENNLFNNYYDDA